MKKIIGIGLTLSIMIILSNPAYAYIDPGTGSMLIQAIIALIAASSVFLGMFWGRVKAFFSRLREKKQSKVDKDSDQQ